MPVASCFWLPSDAGGSPESALGVMLEPDYPRKNDSSVQRLAEGAMKLAQGEP
jgi:hypothetical protein